MSRQAINIGDLIKVRDGVHDDRFSDSRIGLVIALDSKAEVYVIQFGTNEATIHKSFLEVIAPASPPTV